VEWRAIHAGEVTIESRNSRADMNIESAGLVSSLYKIHDTYSVSFDEPFCVTGSLLDAQEGKHHNETTVTYDRNRNHATFVERDLLKDTVLHHYEVDIPNCVHEIISAFLHLRTMNVDPGQSTQIAMSEGHHFANVRIDAQDREDVKTPAGTFRAIRYEAFMMNGVLYTRKGSVFIWLSDNASHVPVQIRLRVAFPIGTVTLQLEKEEHS